LSDTDKLQNHWSFLENRKKKFLFGIYRDIFNP